MSDHKTDETALSPATVPADVVTPWKVEGAVDYARLVKQFGTELIDEDLMRKFERITGKPLHAWLRRGIFFCHRGLHQILDAHENGEPVFIYTGRGPSSDSLHVGHLVPFLFTKWLQEVFDCVVVIQMADDEKYYFKALEFAEVYRLGHENARDIVACGFNPTKTFIFSNRDYRLDVRAFEEFVSTMKKNVPAKQVAKIFGFGEKVVTTPTEGEPAEHYVFGEDVTIGMMDWPFYQTAAAFSEAFPHIFQGRPAHCLVSYAIDQDCYFRMARDLAGRMNLLKPCSIMSTFMSPLTGTGGKMSSSTGQEATLFLTDSPEILRAKIMKHAFSGGGGDGSLSDHKKYGGNPHVDVSYQYLRYFEHDDEALEQIRRGFVAGDITCGQMKQMMADKLIPLIEQHQLRRALITDAEMEEFYRRKPIGLPRPKTRYLTAFEAKIYQLLDELKIDHHTVYHRATTTMTPEIATQLRGTICKTLLLQGKTGMYYLYITTHDNHTINMKTLPKRLGIPKIRFAEKQILKTVLNVPVGYVTVFALMNIPGHDITVVIDETVPRDVPVTFPPLRDDAHTTIKYDDLMRFIDHCGRRRILLT